MQQITLVYKLAEDVLCYVRKAIAKNKLTPTKLLDMLKLDYCSLIRQPVAANPHASVNILRVLLDDKNEEVVRKARSNLNS